jgi:GalNAc-alpha-(1->4)-GalNAc-alpha-(1->3)-diNAcBac-PP-undecaprenol alpha-1,4-N-acetyl-D-galactosaminyltransferase
MKNKIKKHFCFILPSLIVGGMERVMVELANNFVENHNAEVTILLLRNSNKFYYIDPRVRIIEPNFPFNKKHILYLTIKTMLYLRRTINELKPDAVLSFGEKWNAFNLITLFNTKWKVFVSDRSSPKLKLSFVQTWLRRLLYKKAYGIIAQTEDAKSNLFDLTKHSNMITIGNPIREIKEYKEGKRENIILNVGRFISTKQQKQLVEIFSGIKNDNWRLIFVGAGKHFEEAKNRAKELDVENRIQFVGESHNVDEYYLKSKIFAFTSILEGFPNVLGEALSAQIACISYDCHSGARDLIKHDENGYLIKINNIVEYKHKLELLMDDENLRDRFTKKSIIKMEEFSLDRISKKYYNFLTSK